MPPYVAERAPTPGAERNRILFVNPVREHGVELALALAAALPEVPFTFVEPWGLAPQWRAACFERALACGNIEWLPRSTDTGAALARARLLLLPRADEPGGCRLVVEAQRAGVPVLASDRGDLREQVGQGGRVLPLDAPLEDWRAAVTDILADHASYQRGCAAAEDRRNAAGAASDAVVHRLVELLSRHRERSELPHYAGRDTG
jgi:glycosyltransferase involved in cell wall biosynthesis